MRRSAVLAMSLVTAATMPIVSCSQVPADGAKSMSAEATARARADLDTALARWRKAGLANYRFRSRITCFCDSAFTAPATVTVRNGVVVSVVDRATGTARALDDRESIDSVFVGIASALTYPRNIVEATYDSTLGYPRRFSVEPSGVEDADRTIRLDSVEVIP